MTASLLDRALTGPARPDGPDGLAVELEHSSLPLMPQPVAWWRREPGAAGQADQEAADWVARGRVLDVGCGTGRALEALAARGVRGHGIDVSPASIELARAAGVDCVAADVFSYTPPQPVDAVVALGGNGGLAGTLEAFPGFLRRLASWLAPGGRLVLTFSDWSRLPPDRLHLGPAGAPGYRGDVRLRFRLGGLAGPWFPWLFPDQDALRRCCAEAGLRVADSREWHGGVVHGALLVPAS